MALQTIGLGTSPNDGTGDSIRVAGDKINDNFVELYNLLGDGTTLGDATFGNVGIGTTSPSGKLSIQADATSDVDLRIFSDTAYTPRIYLGDTASQTQGAIGYYNSADALFFQSNGSERMRIDSSGNVGIGTSSPAQFVHISKATVGDTSSLLVSNPDGTGGASAALKLGVSPEDNSVAKFAIIHERFSAYGGGDTYFCSNYASDTTEVTDADAVLTIKGSTGNVGIGTTTPDGKLHVLSASAGSVTATADGDELVVEGNFNTGISILSPDLNNTGVYFGSASDNLGAQILWNRTNNRLLIGTDNASAAIHFYTGANALAAEITANGYLGIGATPTVELDIVGNKASYVMNRVYNQSTSAGAQSIFSLQTGSANHLVNIVMNDNTGSGYFQLSSDTGVQAAYYDFAQHIFRNQGGSAERMRIDSSGNVGIGASTPEQLLHVRNDSAGAQASGMLLQNRSATTGSAIGIAFITTTQDFSDNRYSWFGHEQQGDGSNDFIWKTAIGAPAAERMRLSNDGVLTVQSDLVLATTRTPASASATGTTGQIAWDASYIYVCTATNTWRRVAHGTW